MRSVAIDGPVASGKSAVGKRVAEALEHAFLDTGLMYRAVTLCALERAIDLDDEPALARLAREMGLEIRLAPFADAQLLVGGRDVCPELRAPEVDSAVSHVSKVAGVREQMVKQQRVVAQAQPVVMAGRDIGTVVLPAADVKLFLKAGVEERARRRYAEYSAAGDPRTLTDIEEGLRERDRIDSQRTLSPLRPAGDAHIIETDGMSLDQVVEAALELIRSA